MDDAEEVETEPGHEDVDNTATDRQNDLETIFETAASVPAAKNTKPSAAASKKLANKKHKASASSRKRKATVLAPTPGQYRAHLIFMHSVVFVFWNFYFPTGSPLGHEQVTWACRVCTFLNHSGSTFKVCTHVYTHPSENRKRKRNSNLFCFYLFVILQ